VRWFLFILTAPLLAQPAPKDGKSLYLGQCSPCHGADGSGGRGPSLNRLHLVNAPDDTALYRVVRRGIPGTEMPPTWLGDDSVRAIMSYVRELGRVEQTPLVGDAAHGRELYRQAGCGNCHTIAGIGGSLGPDLDTIGASRSASYLKQSLLDPEAAIPNGYEKVMVRTNDGAAFTGVVISGSTFSLQLRDAAGKVHSYWKEEISAIEKPLPRSLMPAYGARLKAGEIADLTAYLAGLGVAQ